MKKRKAKAGWRSVLSSWFVRIPVALLLALFFALLFADEIARAVTDTAREAFMHGLQAVGLISALLMGATALLFAWTVRRAQVTSGHAG